MSSVVDTLVEMGFPRNRAELAVKRTSSSQLETVMEWLLAHEEEPVEMEEMESDVAVSEAAAPVVEAAPENVSSPAAAIDSPPEGGTTTTTTTSTAETSSAPVAKSIKCEECGKLFTTQLEVEFHSTKSGHKNFSESTEEKKPLTEEEKREQLAKIEAKLRQRRLEREAREKQEELEREKVRIRSGKEMLEAKKKQEELEIKKIVEQRKREKEEERLARQRVRDQIEQDKLARKAKFDGKQSEPDQPKPPTNTSPPAAAAAAAVKPPQSQPNYTEVQLQIRLTNGTALKRTFGAKEPLSAVRVYVELNRTDEEGPFTLMIPFPRKEFQPEDYEKPLDVLGLAPSAVLVVKKN